MSLDVLFGNKPQKIKTLERVDININSKKVTMFDYLQDICFFKKGDIHEKKDYEMKAWNSFMILRYLSLENNYVPIINILNEYAGILTPLQLYKTLLLIIPKRKKFLKYPKLHKQMYKDEDIEILKEYFGCSRQDIVDYLGFGFLSEFDIKYIRTRFGGRE